MRSPRMRSILLVAASLGLSAAPSHAQWQTNGAAVCKGAGDDITPQIAPDGAGGAIVTWKDHRGFNYDIWVQRLNAAGVAQWTTDGLPACTANGEHDMPVIVSDGAGGAIIAWKDHRGSNYDIYAQRVNSAGAPQWTLDGEVVCNGAGEHDYPAITSDGAHGAIVSWTDYRAGVNNPDIYAQRMSAGGAALWTPQGVPICTATYLQNLSTIAADGAGGALIAWPDLRDQVAGHISIYAQRVNAGGTTLWTHDGVPVCTATGARFRQQIVADGSGGAIVAWDDQRNLATNSDIYAQHVQSTGTVDPGWTANGNLLCNAINGQAYTQMLADGAGGAILTWQDNRSASATWDPYAQHVQASGAADPAWTPNGTVLCNMVQPQEYPMIATDGAGGAIVAWQDHRTGAYDIYAQRVRASGSVDPAWTANGVALCTAANDQLAPVIVADGAGGAIVAWQDLRNGTDYDIFAQHVYVGGKIVAVPLEAPLPFEVSTEPNPAHAGVTIAFHLPSAMQVSVSIYDVAGRRQRLLAEPRDLPAGSQRFVWDGKSDGGVPVRTGVYLVRVWTGSISMDRRVTILR